MRCLALIGCACLVTVAAADNPNDPPRDPKLEAVARGVRLLPGEISEPGPYQVGDRLTLSFHLQNITDEDIALPEHRFPGGRVFLSPGVEQGWIERLGKATDIPARPASNGRAGAKYADGGTVIVGRPVLQAKERLPLQKRTLDTAGFPPGEYRYTLEWKDQNYRVVQVETVLFELKAGPAGGKPREPAPVAPPPAPDAKLEAVARGVRLLPGEISEPGPYQVGDRLTLSFHLQNITDEDIALPEHRFPGGRVFLSPGVEQGWIERLGKATDIPARSPRNAREGAKYADGGTVIVGRPVLQAKERWPLQKRTLDTAGFPPGEYRYTLEWKDQKDRVVQVETVIFELKAK